MDWPREGWHVFRSQGDARALVVFDHGRIVEFMVLNPAAWPWLDENGWHPPAPNLQPRPRRQPPVTVRAIGPISRTDRHDFDRRGHT